MLPAVVVSVGCKSHLTRSVGNFPYSNLQITARIRPRRRTVYAASMGMNEDGRTQHSSSGSTRKKKKTFSSFEEMVQQKEVVLVDFYAQWCGPCQMMAKVMSECSHDMKDVAFVKIDTEKYHAIASKFQVSALPTLVLFKNGKPIRRLEGALMAPASSPRKKNNVELSDEEQARATLKRLGRYSSALDAVQGVGYLEGKTALVTGANSGIGKETARALYTAGCNIIICCRNIASGEEAAQDIQDVPSKKGSNTCTVVRLDLSDMDSIMACVQSIKDTVPSLHILVLNAGVIVSSLERTKQGFEKGFGVNFVGHYLLTRELLPLVKETSRACPEGFGGRIVGMSSIAHMLGKIQLDDPNFEKTKFSGWKSYGQSKLAMILYMKFLAKTFEQEGTNIKAFSIHPGAIHTKLQQDTTYVKTLFTLFKYFCKTPEQGAATTVVACARGDVLQNGAYLVDCQESTPARQGRDLDMAEKLCAKTDRMIQEKMPAINAK